MPNTRSKKVKDISLFVDNSTNLPDGRLAMIYIVLKALYDKDKLAIELLDAAGYVMFDSDGNMIYPPKEKEHGNQSNQGSQNTEGGEQL